MSILTLRPFASIIASLAVAATMLALVSLGSGTADAGQFCLDLKGQLCVTLTPDPDTNPVGTDHTVTAAATVDGDPLGAVFDAGFAVFAGPNAGETAVVPLGDAGTADFTYTGSGGAGADSILVVMCDVTADCQGFVDDCAQNGSACLDTIGAACQTQLGPVGDTVSAGGIQNFCIGPAVAIKNWVEPTPSPTPVDVGAGGQSPSPTPAQLPQSGGPTGDSGSSGLTWAASIVALAALACAALFTARCAARTR
jgi:hypothetical protein